MATKTQQTAPASRLSRFGKGFSIKTPPAARSHESEKPTEDWYIPYNGPYEVPKEETRGRRERDSWGDVIDGGDEDDVVLGDQDLRDRFGSEAHGEGSRSVIDEHGDERNGRARSRVLSNVSGRTVSSGTVDPSRNSIGTAQRRSTHQARPPVPPVIGGVGESPMPLQRAIRPVSPGSANRGSLVNFFTFSGRKIHRKLSPPSRPLSSNAERTTFPSTESNQISPTTRLRHEQSLKFIKDRSSPGAEQEDYYNSYYSTLIPNPITVDSPLSDHPQQRRSSKSPTESPPPHPYAYAREVQDAELNEAGPSTYVTHVTLTLPPPRTAPAIKTNIPLNTGSTSFLKSSVSTPNLRSVTRTELVRPPKPKSIKGKDRWLSAETWCDALLFPRPRFKLKLDGTYESSGRIVSPPGSPRLWDSHPDDGAFGQQQARVSVLESRVLAHSRSVADLRNEARPSTPKRDAARARGVTVSNVPVQPVAVPSTLRPSRPKSFAQDDLALLSPVPSLTRVWEEGQRLEAQRRQWQIQATTSIGNKQTRSLSRNRSKSFSEKHPAHKENETRKMSSIDFLAARTLMGNQGRMPTVVVSSAHVRTNSTGASAGKKSHSHSNSLAKTISKSSKGSHHRGHSRSESWGKSALKVAKSTTAALCGLNDVVSDERAAGLEDALKGEGTKVIRMPDPAHLPVDYAPIGDLSIRNISRISPTPSGVSDERVGIALSTPPPGSDHSGSGHTYDIESIRLPDHPYAQSSIHHHTAPAVTDYQKPMSKGSDFAGPHLSSSRITSIDPAAALNDVSVRHRLPPQATLHPYAQASSRDSYQGEERIVKYLRLDSNVPPSAKMWASVSPGVVREVLPNDLQYSPFLPDEHRLMGDESPRRDRVPRESIYDTVGVAEALVNATREAGSRDSGLGTSEEYHQLHQAPWVQKEAQLVVDPKRDNHQLELKAHRKPVQYNFSRPTHQQPSNWPSNPVLPHTLSSSHSEIRNPPDFRLQPPTAEDAVNSPDSSPNLPSQSSSPQMSPRPLGSVDDLDNFQDLFYRPSTSYTSSDTSNLASFSRNPSVPWDISSSGRRTGSGLTSLARQLTDEFEEMNARVDGEDSSSGRSDSVQRTSGLQFILSEAPRTTSPLRIPTDSRISAFHPSENVPEDIESSRASSLIDGGSAEGEHTVVYRVGLVESVATPIATSSTHRMSSHLTYVEPAQQSQELSDASYANPRVQSLQPILTASDLTRASYLTSSTSNSRISGLSDFPVPPVQDLIPAHLSVINTYFDASSTPPGEHKERESSQRSNSRRLTFGGDEDVVDLVHALSSYP